MLCDPNPYQKQATDGGFVNSEQILRLYETILSNTPDLIYVFGLDHRFVYANAALLEMWGKTKDESIGKNCLELGYEPWHAQMHDREIDQVIALKQPIRGVVAFTGQKGRRMYDYIFSPVIGPSGDVEAIAGTTRDITDRILFEDALKESESRYRSLFESVDEGFCILELICDEDGKPEDGKVLETNPAFERITGLPNIIGRQILSILPDLDSVWINAFQSVALTGIPQRSVHYAPTSGKWFDVSTFKSGDASSGKLAILISDVTESREKERALREGEAQYRQIAEGLPQMVWSAGPDGIRDYFNGRWLEFTGVGPENCEGPWLSVMHIEDRARASKAWDASVLSGKTFEAEYRLRSREGQYRWFLGRAIAIRNKQGQTVRWFGTCTDIEEQKNAQVTLQITYNFALALAADLDLERIVQSLTDASTFALGAEYGAFFYREDGDDEDIVSLIAASGRKVVGLETLCLGDRSAAFAGCFKSTEIVRRDNVSSDHTYSHILSLDPTVSSYLSAPVISRSGEIIGILIFAHPAPEIFTSQHERIVSSFVAQAATAIDNARLYERLRLMNEDLEARVQARTSDLLAAIERLQGFTSHVSHDLRSPLRAIASTSRIIQEDFGTKLPDEVLRLLTRQADAGTRLGKLVDDLLKLSRISKQEMIRQRVDVSFLAQDVFVEAQSTHPYSKASIDISDNLYTEADPRLLRLALHNLIENAVKYSPQGGTIIVGQREDGAFFVRDEGIGMEPQYLEKIFEPFQRLHRDDEYSGTGIGLANVKQVIDRHGGEIWAESGLGSGATFYFKFNQK